MQTAKQTLEVKPSTRGALFAKEKYLYKKAEEASTPKKLPVKVYMSAK